jgi:hypothetical protein
MPKIKTRKQKQIADKRRQVFAESTYSFDYNPTYKPASKEASIQPKTTIDPSGIYTSGYTYLNHDLRKTIIVTLAVILVELVLYFGNFGHIFR